MNEERLEAALTALNGQQQSAVEHVTNGWQGRNGSVRLSIVDGPPGTGKTHVAAATAGRWILDRGNKVVILTPTKRSAERAHRAVQDVGLSDQEALRLEYAPRLAEAAGVIKFKE